MIIRSANFIASNTELAKMPQNGLPEYAFIGRSNVGKSSLINRLTQKKGLAKTSQTPGKTQLINHFLINEIFYLVDLPGYGYARVSKSAKEKWGKFISLYLEKRRALQGVFVLIDSRLPPQPIDLEFIDWLASRSIPLVITFTKSDKQNPGKTAQTVRLFLNEMDQVFSDTPKFVITSAEKGDGMEELLEIIRKGNELYIPEPIVQNPAPENPLPIITENYDLMEFNPLKKDDPIRPDPPRKSKFKTLKPPSKK